MLFIKKIEVGFIWRNVSFIALLFLVIKLLPLYGLPLVTADDLWFQNQIQLGGIPELIGSAKSFAKSIGRLSLFPAGILWGISLYFNSELWLFICRAFPVLLNVFLFYRFVELWFSRRLADISICLLVLILYVGLNYYVVGSYPLVYTSVFSLNFLGLICAKQSRPLWLCSFLLVLPCLVYEMFCPIWLVCVLLILKEKQNRSLKKLLIFVLPFLMWTVSYLVFYRMSPKIANYQGSVVGKISLSQIFITWWSFCTGVFLGELQWQQILIYFKFNLLTTASIMFLSLIYLNKNMYSKSNKAPSAVPLLVGIALLIAPEFLISLTPKYQEWSVLGVRAYVPTYFSHFGYALALGVILNSIWDFKYLRLLSFFIVALIGIQSNSVTNHSLSVLTQAGNRINSIVEFARKQADQDRCYQTNLWEPIEGWSCCHSELEEEFWNRLVLWKSGIKIHLYPRTKGAINRSLAKCDQIVF